MKNTTHNFMYIRASYFFILFFTISFGLLGSMMISAHSDDKVTYDIPADTSLNTTIRLDASNVSDLDSMPIEAEFVSVNAEMPAFVRSILKSDSNIKEIEATPDSVRIAYKLPAKYMGFISGTIAVNVSVNASGLVTLSYPWYKFLASTPQKDSGETTLETDINTKIQTLNDNNSTTTAKTTFSAHEKADTIEVVHGVLASYK